MDTKDTKKPEEVEALLKKAASCEKSEDSMRFSQAALNCSHTRQVLLQIEINSKETE